MRNPFILFSTFAAALIVSGNSLAASARDLPAPTGGSLTYFHQEQDYSVKSLTLGSANPFISQAVNGLLAQSPKITVENELDEFHAKLDYWALPFLNVFGLVGYVDGETSIDTGGLLPDFDVDYDGIVYGAGLTAIAAKDSIFGLVTLIYTETDLDTSDSSIETVVVNPQIGCTSDSGTYWIGAMYQDVEEAHMGTFNVPQLGPLQYDVVLEEDEPWNYQVGARFDLGNTVTLDLEVGFGDREHALASLAYRF